MGLQVSKRSVLVVEDDPDGRAVLKAILAIDGYTVATARNGFEALQRAREVQPDVILLDLMMPVMDGRGFRAAQAQDPEIAHIPVLVVSAHSDALNISRLMGAAGCIGKPIEFDHLLFKVQACCRAITPPA